MAGMNFSQPSAFSLKRYLDRVAGKLIENLHYGMDYDLFSRLACVCDLISVEEGFAKDRFHEVSKTVARCSQFLKEWSRFL